MRVLIFVAVVLVGCSSTATDAPTSAAPETEVRPIEEPPADEPTCSVQLIRRAGLDTRTPECVDGIERFGELPSADLACASDADCSIYMAARGCLGVNVRTSAHERMEPLYAACIMDDTECASADFSDHRVACRQGCCVIFEE